MPFSIVVFAGFLCRFAVFPFAIFLARNGKLRQKLALDKMDFGRSKILGSVFPKYRGMVQGPKYQTQNIIECFVCAASANFENIVFHHEKERGNQENPEKSRKIEL